MSSFMKNHNSLKEIRHRYCIFHDENIDFEFWFDDSGVFIGKFFCDKKYQGYDGMMHGGVLSAIIDSAMTRCLFGHGIVGYTARLNIKYLKPVKINRFIKLMAYIEKNENNYFYDLKAVILQEDKKHVTADSKFWIVNK